MGGWVRTNPNVVRIEKSVRKNGPSLTPSVDVGTRGHDYKLFKERYETITRGHFFTNRVIDLWNSLPQDVVTAPSRSNSSSL